MAKDDDKLTVEGTVVEALPGTQFRVELENGSKFWLISLVRCGAIISAFCWEIASGWKFHPMT